MISCGIFLYLNFSNSKDARAAVAGDFRSVASGNWNTVATWERYNGSAWVVPIAAPLSTDGTISIKSGHTVTVTSLVTGDQIVVDAGGTLTIGTAGMTLANGTGSDLIVDGTLNISNTLTLTNAANADVNSLATLKPGGTITFIGASLINVNGRFRRTGGSMSNTASYWSVNNGGIFEHAINGGSLLPSLVWKAGSTCEVTGITSSMPSNINQTFHHFKWNCPNQTAGFDFNARFDSVIGNLTIISTGAATLQFDYQGNNNVTNIGGDLIIQGGTSYGCANGSGIFNIGGNYLQTGGSFAFNQAGANAYGSTSITLNITGNVIMTGGMMDMTQSTANNANVGKGHINLSGNINLSGTALLTQTSADSHGEIVFTGTAIQTYDLNNLVTNKIDFIIDPGATVRTNLNLLTSDGIFTLKDGGHLMIASPEGITQTGLQGNVRVTGTRTYGTGADYTYEGASVQVTGNGLPATVRNLYFDNSNNVTLTNSTSATNIITFINGKILLNLDTEEDNELTIGCAGGVDVTAAGTYNQETPEHKSALRISVKGLTGGHSGVDIHKGRANANKLLNRLLTGLTNSFKISIAVIDGGSLRNAIPREAVADVVVAENSVTEIKNAISNFNAIVQKENNFTDPNLNISCENIPTPVKVLNSSFQSALLRSVYACPNGIYRMTPSILGLVQTSNNVARMLVKDGNYSVQCLTRSSVNSEKADLAQAITASFELAGATVSLGGSYPGWEPKPDAPIVKLMSELYLERYNEPANVDAIHAGLECGILGTNYPGMQMISFGPNIYGAHSPDEKVQISSVQKFWGYLLEVLKRIPSKAA